MTSDVVEGGLFVGYLRIREGNGWQLEAWRFDKGGTALLGPIVVESGTGPPQPWIGLTAGADVNQNSLLAYQRGGSPALSAVWLDLAGEIIAAREFQLGDALYNYRGLIPLYDGSFVLRRQTGSLRVPAWDEEGDLQPAPQWIEDHPATDLYFIRNMRGYALAPRASYSEPCEREIFIFARDGTFCGSFAPEPTAFCPTVIGKDGTVFRPSDEVLPCGSENCGCTQHYWVGLLR